MKEFPVKYRGEILQVQVDDEDAVRIEEILRTGGEGCWKTRARKLSYVPAWKNRGFRPALWFEGKLRYLSRFILGLLNKNVSHLIVDHIDQNPLNNQKSNLRVVDRRTNAINCVKKRDQKCSSKYKGVCWSKQAGRWMAYVQTADKKRVTRMAKTEEGAHRLRLELEEEYYK